MRKLVVTTASGLVENVIEVPEPHLLVAAAAAKAAAEAAKAALVPGDHDAAAKIDAALVEAIKCCRMLEWTPPEAVSYGTTYQGQVQVTVL